MRNDALARDYLIKGEKRLLILSVLLKEEAYSDVVREAQEIVELTLKGILRQIGIEPPKWHDVGKLILEYKDRLPKEVAKNASCLAKISKQLRKERELAFYGDIDFIPSEGYTIEDAKKAIEDARFVVTQAQKVIQP
jgi:hypothetical protein